MLLSTDSGEGCGANAMTGTKRGLEGQQDDSKGRALAAQARQLGSVPRTLD